MNIGVFPVFLQDSCEARKRDARFWPNVDVQRLPIPVGFWPKAVLLAVDNVRIRRRSELSRAIRWRAYEFMPQKRVPATADIVYVT